MSLLSQEGLLVGQLLVAALLTGLIWTVQLAVYPQFARILEAAGEGGFRAYHADYTRGIGWVAGPLMLGELVLVTLALMLGPRGAPAWVGFFGVLLLWAHTFFWMVPLHARLQSTPSPRLVRRLVRLNWLRCALWSLRLAGLVAAGRNLVAVSS
jgi:hypothetical protein